MWWLNREFPGDSLNWREDGGFPVVLQARSAVRTEVVAPASRPNPRTAATSRSDQGAILASVREHLIGHRSERQCIVEFAIGEQSGIEDDHGVAVANVRSPADTS